MFFSLAKTADEAPKSEEKPTVKTAGNLELGPNNQPQANYDEGATQLYKYIQDKNWDKVIARISVAPHEATTWIYRRNEKTNSLRWRLLPLHATCIFRSPLSVIEALVESYPEGAKMKDDQEMLPIHLACRNGASKGVVTTLLKVFPESIHVKDRKGRTAMQLVESSSSQNRDAVIEVLKKHSGTNEDGEGNGDAASNGMNVTKESIATGPNEVDYEHRTVLFRLIVKKDWTGTCHRAESFPQEASTWIITKGFHGNLRFNPLHKACVLQPPISVIDALITANPDGAKERDQDGWLPLHCACFYGASASIIEKLIEAYPQGAHTKDDEGRMPLHYATLKSAPEPIIAALLRANPKAALSKDDEGRLPIHHACSKNASDEAIEALLKVSPRGAQSKDDQGRLPIHHSCRKNGSARVIRNLLRIYPRGSQVRDDQEKLAIHYACQNGVSETIINMLMVAYPESVHAKNGFGYTPLAEAKAMCNHDLVSAIERFKKENSLNEAPVTVISHGELESSVTKLNSRVEFLESLLGDVAKIGTDLKQTVMNSDSEQDQKVGMLAEKLSQISPTPETRNDSSQNDS